MTAETNNVTRAELLPGMLFIAPDGVPGDEITSDEYYAGPTEGKIELSVRENVQSVRDLCGEKVCDIHYGGRLEIKGRLASISPAAAARLLGARRTSGGRCGICDAPEVRRLSVCVVCPIAGDPNGFSILVRTATDAGGALTLDATGKEGLDFKVVSEKEYGKASATISFGEGIA